MRSSGGRCPPFRSRESRWVCQGEVTGGSDFLVLLTPLFVYKYPPAIARPQAALYRIGTGGNGRRLPGRLSRPKAQAAAPPVERATKFAGMGFTGLRKMGGWIAWRRPAKVAAFWKQAGLFEECR
jgi:hypothetical protein